MDHSERRAVPQREVSRLQVGPDPHVAFAGAGGGSDSF